MPSKMVVHTQDGSFLRETTSVHTKPEVEQEQEDGKEKVPTRRQVKKQSQSGKK